MPKRLTRNPRGAVLGGVAGGFADYFNIDPVIARLAFILLCFLNGIGLIVYIVSWIIIPREGVGDPAAAGSGSGAVPPSAETAPGAGVSDGGRDVTDKVREATEKVRQAGERVVDDLRRSGSEERRGGLIGGLILIVLGLFFLVDRLPWLYWPHWVHISSLWPLILIVLGAVMILGARRGKRS